MLLSRCDRASESLLRHLRGPEGDLAQIRAVFKPSISDIAGIFGVSRQSVYNWIAGEKPSQESVERLDDLARAADLFLARWGRRFFISVQT